MNKELNESNTNNKYGIHLRHHSAHVLRRGGGGTVPNAWGPSKLYQIDLKAAKKNYFINSPRGAIEFGGF